MKVKVLGAEYSVTIISDDKELRLKDCDGFCDETSCEIFAESYSAVADDPRSKSHLEVQTKKVIRHEITHAFLFESGLAENSPWAQNEEIVDWIAIQGPKLYKAWQEADAL